MTTVSQFQTHTMAHAVTVAASPDHVYDIVADATTWPNIFGPTIYVRRLEGDGTEERLQLWATANGAARTWTSRRRLDPAARRIEFRQERSPAPLESMGGTWTFHLLPEGGTQVVLDHDFTVIDNDPAGLAWISKAVDSNSHAELAALKAHAETAANALELSFADEVRVSAAAEEVYDFVYRADLWPQRLPHVTRLDLTEEQHGLQIMEMDTQTADGSTHTTHSTRVCFAPHRIVYKQTILPKLMTLHTGEWTIERDGDAVVVTSRHTVRINPDTVTEVLGADKTTDDAREYVRTALSHNSMTTLRHAKQYAQGRKHA
jgi:aromatase